MTATRLRSLLDQIEQLSGGAGERQGTDRQLLDDFSTRHDEAAFAELVARHGPLVLRVCRRVLHHEQDAEDAFQATFLVLARCVGSIRKREALADWLHGVAYRTAMKAKRTAARRRNHETRLREQTPTVVSPTWDDVQAILDEEIQRLPASFRSAFVLCALEGKTVPAAAAELGWKEGTMSSRLTRARQRLQRQLERRGIQLAALLAALCVAEGVAKAVPGTLAQTVIRNGLVVAAGGSAAGAIPPHVAALAAGVTRAMFMHKAKIAVVVLMTLGLFVAGAGVLTHQLLKAEEKPLAAQPAVKPPAEPAKPAEDTIEVTGRVLDPDGKPVAKARLYQSRWLKEDADVEYFADSDVFPLGVADAEGRFRVKLVRPSSFSRQPLRLLAAADGFGLNWLELPKDEKPADVTLRLVKDQVVRGRLLNTEGKPVVGVTVEVTALYVLADYLDFLREKAAEGKVSHPPDVSTKLNKVVRVPATDKDGRFEIAGLGSERAIVIKLKSATASIPPFVIVTREGFDPKSLKLGKGNIWFGPSFESAVVLPTRSVEGTVRAAGGDKPVVGATVRAWDGYYNVEGVTDAKGHYQLNGLMKADKYTVAVLPGNQTVPLLSDGAVVTAPPGLETVRCNVELHRGVEVTGRVLDKATGKGVKSDVHWVPLPDKDSENKGRFRGVKTDGEGRFSLVTVPGPGVLLAEVSGVVNQVDVNPYKTAEFDETDRKRVKVMKDKDPDEGGHYFVRADGRWEFLDNYNACRVVDLQEGNAAAVCDLTVDPGKTRTLNLEDPDGKPLPGVMASGLGLKQWNVATVKTAACPVFVLDAERPRQVALLHKERKLFALVSVRGDGQEPLAVRLAPTAILTGRLLDDTGKPLADATILVGYSEGAAWDIAVDEWNYSPRPRTDKDGRFRLDSVFPGLKFTISAHKGPKAFLEEKKTERESLKAGATLDLGDIRVKARSP